MMWNVTDLLSTYATDTSKIDNPYPDRKYDYIFLESNYDDKKLEAIGPGYMKRGYDPFWNARRHLSTKDCKTFYYMNRKTADSPLIELHMSKRFY
jgi:hypothetical protein